MARETATGLIFTRAGCSIACREVKSDVQKFQSCSRSRCCANLYSKEKEEERAKHIQSANPRNFSKKPSTGNNRTRTTTHQTTIRQGTATGGAKRLNHGDNSDCCSRRNENRQPKIMVKSPSFLPEARRLPKDPPDFAGRISERLQNRSLRASKQVIRQSLSGNHGSTKISSMSKFSELAAKRTSQGMGAGSQNNVLKRNVKSSVRSDALPRLLSSVDSGASKRFDLQKRSSNRESPSSRAQSSRRPISRTIQEPKAKKTGIRKQQQAGNSTSTRVLPTRGNDSRNFQNVPWDMDAIVEDDETTSEQDSAANDYSSLDHSYDEFRDMRMDIDDMSYEELLALEESIGNVKTALTEEALSKCVHRTSYTSACLVPEEDATCSICQEDYAPGEELGKLLCSHQYHLACIQDWFQLKNWCPMCKASMSPTN